MALSDTYRLLVGAVIAPQVVSYMLAAAGGGLACWALIYLCLCDPQGTLKCPAELALVLSPLLISGHLAMKPEDCMGRTATCSTMIDPSPPQPQGLSSCMLPQPASNLSFTQGCTKVQVDEEDAPSSKVRLVAEPLHLPASQDAARPSRRFPAGCIPLLGSSAKLTAWLGSASPIAKSRSV